jgi:hypothetical protein
MKASELRIGNYVNVPIKEQCPFRIDAFEYCSEKFIKVAQEVKLNGFEVHPLTWYGGDLQPIPLTEEWLLKFGFEKTEWDNFNSYRLMIGNNNYAIVLYSDGNCEVGDIITCKIEYIHLLQNLYFALTGEELTIK